MITLSFLWSWTKLTGLAALALLLERALIPGFWVFALAAGITIGAWAVITAALLREWRAQAAGYHHQLTSIRRDRS
ncbi:hypothetical protein [Amycolatopsis sp.]|uniref:hypothetical protein n=1 Tax=Amycolatopsis sp. TaxID=37632 RepID=UPI002CCA31F9|nr:hypothetical protein [Amycolatopsis sp.]HVV09222.1 hypothetical protein [Amycolatopsis sp.]